MKVNVEMILKDCTGMRQLYIFKIKIKFYTISIFFSIMNSLVIVLFLSGMIGMILLRTLHRDITRYNQLIDSGVSILTVQHGGWYLESVCHASG